MTPLLRQIIHGIVTKLRCEDRNLASTMISHDPGTTAFKRSNAQRVATRYDKLAADCLAFVELASIRLWLRVTESGP
jgi:transposase